MNTFNKTSLMTIVMLLCMSLCANAQKNSKKSTQKFVSGKYLSNGWNVTSVEKHSITFSNGTFVAKDPDKFPVVYTTDQTINGMSLTQVLFYAGNTDTSDLEVYGTYSVVASDKIRMTVTGVRGFSISANLWSHVGKDYYFFFGKDSNGNYIKINNGSDFDYYYCEDGPATPTVKTLEKSGTCGNGVSYTFNDGTLVISGKGDMTDYKYSSESPFSEINSIKNIIIKDGVTNIGSYAFARCKNLTSVAIPSSVSSIGDGAFDWCDKIAAVTIPMNTKCSKKAFYSKTEITININDILSFDPTATGIVENGSCGADVKYSILNNGTLVIFGDGEMKDYDNFVKKDNSPFYKNQYQIKKVIINDGVKSIGKDAFTYCESLTTVTIPNSVTKIGERAFNNCKNLTSVKIPDSVTEIGAAAFSMCSSLKYVTIPNSISEIKEYTFKSTNLESIEIPNSVTEIGMGAFNDCNNLTSVTIPNSVNKIETSAFAYCNNLTNITITNPNLNLIGNAFSRTSKDCPKREIVLPKGIKCGDKVFDKRTKIVYSDAVLSVPSGDSSSEGEIYEEVDQPPVYPGGTQGLIEYLSSNLRYPANAQKNGIQGKVICSFVVNKDGSVVEAKVLTSVDPELDAEAVRVILAMPKWTPGYYHGKAVRVRFSLPITFRLKADAPAKTTK